MGAVKHILEIRVSVFADRPEEQLVIWLPTVDGIEGASLTISRSKIDGAVLVFFNEPDDEDPVFWNFVGLPRQMDHFRIFRNLQLFTSTDEGSVVLTQPLDAAECYDMTTDAKGHPTIAQTEMALAIRASQKEGT